MTQRYWTLDAMRGVAALAVAFFHATGELPSAPLAVDLFFALSGFVLAHAYQERFAAGMTAVQFMRARLLRLYPLYLVGTLGGLAYIGLDLLSGSAAIGGREYAVAAGLSLLMLPSPAGAALYPLNLPAWSLLFELLVNLAWVLVWRRLSLTVLVAILVVGAAGLVAFGGISDGSVWTSFGNSLARVVFAFTLGVLIFRFRPRPHVSAWWWVPPAAVLLPFVSPHSSWGQLGLLFFGIPALIVAGAALQPRAPRLADFLGLVSYPIYVLHWPSLLFLAAAASRLGWDRLLLFPFAAGLLLLVSWAAARWFDEPVRRKLARAMRIAPVTGPAAAP